MRDHYIGQKPETHPEICCDHWNDVLSEHLVQRLFEIMCRFLEGIDDVLPLIQRDSNLLKSGQLVSIIDRAAKSAAPLPIRRNLGVMTE